MSEVKPENLSFDEFVKWDLRAGSITKIEEVPKSKKLVKLEVSFGTFSRTILAGIKGSPSLVEGQKVVAVLNLAPRAMMGFESHGMLLASHDENHTIWLINPGPVPDGTNVG